MKRCEMSAERRGEGLGRNQRARGARRSCACNTTPHLCATAVPACTEGSASNDGKRSAIGGSVDQWAGDNGMREGRVKTCEVVARVGGNDRGGAEARGRREERGAARGRQRREVSLTGEAGGGEGRNGQKREESET